MLVAPARYVVTRAIFDMAGRYDAPVTVSGSPDAHHDACAGYRLERIPGDDATLHWVKIDGANLSHLRRVDPGQPDALAADPQRVAVHDGRGAGEGDGGCGGEDEEG